MAGLLERHRSGPQLARAGLGDVPVLGALFRSVRYVQGETELVVLVTASLVEPLSIAGDPPLPGVLDMPARRLGTLRRRTDRGRKTATLSSYESAWLTKLGFDQLEGPGTWETYEQGPAQSAPRSPSRRSPALSSSRL